MRKMALIALMFASVAGAGGAQAPREATPSQLDAAKLEAARSTLSVQSRITTGAPYSAEAVTESTQALSDGNRIATKTVARIYRDGEGRTRREQVDVETGAVRTVTISDPVAGVSYTLDVVNRVATRMGAVMATAGGGGFRGAVPGARGAAVARTPEGSGTPAADLEKMKRAVEEMQARSVAPAREIPSPATAAPLPAGVGGAGGRGRGPLGETTREELAVQMIEGVQATGTRSTTVIPAGAVGNLQPIKIVSEQWMSPDLKVLVMTKHNDPRTGETTYRLTSIVRAEPDRSLFGVPPDYTVREVAVRRDQPR